MSDNDNYDPDSDSLLEALGELLSVLVSSAMRALAFSRENEERCRDDEK